VGRRLLAQQLRGCALQIESLDIKLQRLRPGRPWRQLGRPAGGLRAAYRSRDSPGYRLNGLGFRCAR